MPPPPPRKEKKQQGQQQQGPLDAGNQQGPPPSEGDEIDGLRIPFDYLSDDTEILRAELSMLQTPASQDYRDISYIMLQNIRSECNNDFVNYCNNNAYETLFNMQDGDDLVDPAFTLFMSPDSPFAVFNDFTEQRRRSLRDVEVKELPFHKRIMNEVHRTMFTPFFSGPLGTVFHQPDDNDNFQQRQTPIDSGIHHGGIIVGIPPQETAAQADQNMQINKVGADGHGVYHPPQEIRSQVTTKIGGNGHGIYHPPKKRS